MDTWDALFNRGGNRFGHSIHKSLPVVLEDIVYVGRVEIPQATVLVLPFLSVLWVGVVPLGAQWRLVSEMRIAVRYE